ncbi:MAG: amidohydrolase family protein [Bryobacteraceae bacterium]
MTRREWIAMGAASLGAAPAKTPVVNGAEHVWVRNTRFPMAAATSVCPANMPDHEYSAEFLLSEMRTYRVDSVVISHVCYYGYDNSYPAWCVKTYPGKFAAIGLLVGHRLHSPADPENPARLEKLIKEDGLIGLRLSPIYNRETVWLNDPACYPLWKKAEQLGATFNIFLAPDQVKQVGDMAARFPGVNVVIDHIAMIDITAADEAGFGPLLDLARHPNVYIRTSLHNPSKTKQMPYRDVWPFLRRLYDRYGAKRMLWANFFEYAIMKEVIPFFTAEDKEWILGRTAHKLYGFGKRA